MTAASTTPTASRVWMCEIDIQRWDEVACLLNPRRYPSHRLDVQARIAAATAAALVSVALHELAGPAVERGARIDLVSGRFEDTPTRPLDSVQYDVAYGPGLVAVAAGFDPLGLYVEPVGVREPSHLQELVRARAALKASGTITPAGSEELALPAAGWSDVSGNRLWITDIDWRSSHAVAMAAFDAGTPQTISTTASQVVERWESVVDGEKQERSGLSHAHEG